MNNLEKQQKNVNELIKLIKENPELEIVPMVDSECVPCDDYSYWMAEWGTARVDEYHHDDERIYFKEQDFEELVGDFIDNNYEYYSHLGDDEIRDVAEREVSNLEWIKAIVVYIRPV